MSQISTKTVCHSLAANGLCQRPYHHRGILSEGIVQLHNGWVSLFDSLGTLQGNALRAAEMPQEYIALCFSGHVPSQCSVACNGTRTDGLVKCHQESGRFI